LFGLFAENQIGNESILSLDLVEHCSHEQESAGDTEVVKFSKKNCNPGEDSAIRLKEFHSNEPSNSDKPSCEYHKVITPPPKRLV
jgi:hypothetical protein